MQKRMFSLACVLFFGMHENVNAADPAGSICTPGGPSALESSAAREVRRYVYLRTGELQPIRSERVVAGAPSILAARKDRPEIKALAGDPTLLAAVAALKPQEYLLKSIGPNLLLIAGGAMMRASCMARMRLRRSWASGSICMAMSCPMGRSHS